MLFPQHSQRCNSSDDGATSGTLLGLGSPQKMTPYMQYQSWHERHCIPELEVSAAREQHKVDLKSSSLGFLFNPIMQ